MPPIENVWQYPVLGVMLVAAAIADVRRGKIPNWLTYSGVAVGLIGNALVGGWGGDSDKLGLLGSLGGLAAGFLPMLAVWLAGGIGGGDAKLAGAVGALAGWRFALSTLLFGLLAAMVMAVIVMLRRRILRRTLARVGRFVYLAFTPGKPADPTSADSPKIPFGLALCLGACVALVEVFWRGGGAPKWFLGI